MRLVGGVNKWEEKSRLEQKEEKKNREKERDASWQEARPSRCEKS